MSRPVITIPPKYTRRYPDRHGKWREEFRYKGKVTALPGLPGEPEYELRYAELKLAALRGTYLSGGHAARSDTQERRREHGGAGSLDAALKDYYGHFLFKHDLAASTQQRRRKVLDSLAGGDGGEDKGKGRKPIGRMRPVDVERWLAKAETPNIARGRLVALRHFFIVAVKLGYAKADPTAGMPLPEDKHPGELPSWAADDIATFRAFYPLPEVREPPNSRTLPRLVMELAFHLGARRGDLTTLRPQHISDGCLTYADTKTRAVRSERQTAPDPIQVPIHDDLQLVLDHYRFEHAVFLTTRTGRPYHPNALSALVRKWCDAAGLHGLSLHGLRKGLVGSLAEYGAGDEQIMSITGHKDARMVRLYAKGARKRVMAANGIGRLPTELSKQNKNRTVSNRRSAVSNRAAGSSK